MQKCYLDIAKAWGVVMAWDISHDDLDEIGEWLDALGCDHDDIDDALSAIMRKNTGFTYSNPKLKMSLVCIGNATDKAQWWDTLAHELDHVQTAICKHYGVELDSEESAYLTGYLMRQFVRAARGR